MSNSKSQTKQTGGTFSGNPLSSGIILLGAAMLLGWLWAGVDLVATLFFVDMITGGRVVRDSVKAVLTTLWSLLELTWAASSAVRENVWASRFVIGVMIVDFGTDLFYVQERVQVMLAHPFAQQALTGLGLADSAIAHNAIWITLAGIATFVPQLLMIEFGKLAAEHLYYGATQQNLRNNTKWAGIADIGILVVALIIGMWVVTTQGIA